LKGFRVHRLEVVDADLATPDMGRNREHRQAVAVCVVKSVDEMGLAGPQLPVQTVSFQARWASALRNGSLGSVATTAGFLSSPEKGVVSVEVTRVQDGIGHSTHPRNLLNE
jgi:hypothetical protein